MQNIMGARRSKYKKTNCNTKGHGDGIRFQNKTEIGKHMTIAMIMSQDRLEQEHTMLNRLVVGLINDGRQVIRIIPTPANDELAPYEKAVSLAKRVCVSMPVTWLLRSARRDTIVEALQKTEASVITVFGRQALKVAADVKAALDIPVLYEVVSMRDAKRTKSSSQVSRWFAATPSIQSAIAQRVGQDRAALVPLGIATPTSSKEHLAMSASYRCLVILDATSDPKATRTILNLLSKMQNINIFLELSGRKQHQVWRCVRDLDMHDRVTCLREVSELRSLIVRCDLVILPAQSVPIRTVLLEAMRYGVPVVSAQIDGFDMLVDEETALIVNGNWKESLERILDDSDLAKRIGQGGSDLVAAHYASATQIAAFDDAVSLL